MAENFKLQQGLDVASSVDAFIPTGAIITYGGASYSADPISSLGMCPCDGRAISRTTYSDLYAVIGTTWGIGDGSTTFNVPNFSDSIKFLSGANANTNLNTTTGSASHTHTAGGTNASSGTSSFDHNHNYGIYIEGGGGGYHTHYLGAFYMYNSGAASPAVFKTDGAVSGAAINHVHSGYVPGLGWGNAPGANAQHNAGGSLTSTGSTTSHQHSMAVATTVSSASVYPSYVTAIHYIKL